MEKKKNNLKHMYEHCLTFIHTYVLSGWLVLENELMGLTWLSFKLNQNFGQTQQPVAGVWVWVGFGMFNPHSNPI